MKSKDGKTMQPLCMAQHYQIFRIYRRPGVNNDEQLILDRASSGDHIIIAHHNQVGFRDGQYCIDTKRLTRDFYTLLLIQDLLNGFKLIVIICTVTDFLFSIDCSAEKSIDSLNY